MAAKPDDPNPTPTPKPRRRWWLGIGALVLLLILALGVAALPWLLGTSTARHWLLARANATLAPARLEVKTFAFSWLGATRMRDFRIYDHRGDLIIASPSAVWDRNLWQAIFDRPRFGTLTLPGGKLDVEREPDGTIDLYEALRPILTGGRRTQFRVRLTDGTLQLRSDGLRESLRGTIRELRIDRPPAPEPVVWKLTLEQGDGRSGTRRLSSQGTYERWKDEPGGGHPIAFDLVGSDWPLALGAAGLDLRGRLDGRLGFARREGAWRLTGDAAIADCALDGARLKGDRLMLERVKGLWDVSEEEWGWHVTRLDLESPIGTLQASGPLPAPKGQATRIEGQLDLAALAAQIPHALRLREGLTLDRGQARLTIASAENAGRRAWDVRAEISDLIARLDERTITVKQPATLSAQLVDEGGLSVAWLELESAFLKVRGSGDVDQGVTIAGTLELAALKKQACDWIDLEGFDLAGHGVIAGEYRRLGGSYAGRLTLDLSDLALGRSGVGGVHADAARLIASLDGPADGSGIPEGWERARLTLRSDDLAADALVLAEANRPALLAVAADSALRLGGEPGRANGRVVARREGTTWVIDEAAVALASNREHAEGTAEILMSGRLDPAAGTLVLEPTGPATGAAVALGLEGLSVAGLGGPEWRARGHWVGEAGSLGRFLAEWSGKPDPGLSGNWSLRGDLSDGPDHPIRFAGKLELPDLSWPSSKGDRSGPGPLAIDASGSYRSISDELIFNELVASGRYLTIEADGRVVEPAGARRIDLQGRLTPDWKALTAWLGENVEPGAYVSGNSRSFTVKGPLRLEAADPLAGLQAEAGFELEELDVFGMRLGSTPVVLHLDDGAVTLDPIRTTLNGGTLRLDPAIERGEDGSWTFRLEPGSALVDAEVNDEVSHRVLSFVAPVLDRASRVRGRVSAEIERAEFPIGPGFGRKAVVKGRMVFQDVAFAPGPLAASLVGLVGAEAATIRLDEPVVLAIADGRIHQRGLAVPVGRLTQIELAGDVGFDRSLDLTASLPITRPMVANNDLLGDVVEGTRISVPIGGTLADPQVDRLAFRDAMNDLGKTLLRRAATRGAAELIFQLAQPRELRLQQRRQRRQERQERRRNR